MNNSTLGVLYIVGTPLGNLEDITYRALRILAEVDLIAAEDTRHTIKLLNHFQIKKKMISYFQHNEQVRTAELIEKLQSGLQIALVSDAGMPGISDPGSYLVAEAIRQGITVVPIPGPSAVITALAGSGLDTHSFRFEGFLPRKKIEQRHRLQDMKEFPGTLVLYESPHRLIKTLQSILGILGDRQIVLARELTKIHEEFVRGRLAELLPQLETAEIRGEFTVLISGITKEATTPEEPTKFDIEELGLSEEKGSLRKKMKILAEKNGVSVKEYYQKYLATHAETKK